jgi:hypothetical protein
MTSSKWATIAKCSQDTANRDIAALRDLGLLRKGDAGGGEGLGLIDPVEAGANGVRNPGRTRTEAGSIQAGPPGEGNWETYVRHSEPFVSW